MVEASITRDLPAAQPAPTPSDAAGAASRPAWLRSDSIANALSVDVEDYFHVSAFEQHIPRSAWERLPWRVEHNTERILGLFAEHQVTATFFVLGWVAERFPGLIRRIVAEGHELASHGAEHVRVYNQAPADFRQDVSRTKALLEDVGGVPVAGYRAASYSIGQANRWALDILAETGHAYSSSIYPVKHDLYGSLPEAERFPFQHCDSGLLEIPISTVQLFGKNWPAGGGGFFRLYPYAVSRRAIRRINQREGQPAVFYFHPWEIDPGQPRQRGLPLRTRLRHYLNLHDTLRRLDRLLTDFTWQRLDTTFVTANPAPPTADRSS